MYLIYDKCNVNVLYLTYDLSTVYQHNANIYCKI